MISSLIIAGFMRSGTTSAFRYLVATKCFATSSVKEMDYFINDDSGSQDVYFSQFIDRKDKVTLDVSPRYARHYKDSSRLIERCLTSKKILFLLRDPVQRVESIFSATKRSGKINSHVTFPQFSKAIVSGDYSNVFQNSKIGAELIIELNLDYLEVIQHFESVCGSSNIQLEFFESLQNSPIDFINRVAGYCDISSLSQLDMNFEVENKSMSVKSALIYKIALIVNNKMEPLFNKYPRIRSYFRRAHDRLNSASANQDTSTDIALLRRYYSDMVFRLSEYVQEKNITDIPCWISSAKMDGSPNAG